MTAVPEHARADAGARVPEASLVAARAAESKQGEATAVLAMSGTLGVTDAFVDHERSQLAPGPHDRRRGRAPGQDRFGRSPLRVGGATTSAGC